MYVVVRARVLQLGAELAMLADFMETYLFQEYILNSHSKYYMCRDVKCSLCPSLLVGGNLWGSESNEILEKG